MPAAEEPLEALVRQVGASARYRQVMPALVRAIGAAELRAQPRPKEALKATKNRLHQLYGAFYEAPPRYREWLELLRTAAAPGDAATLRAACAALLRHHASTRERLPLLDRFYVEALRGLPPTRSVLDLCCGLHPLALPWMGLACRSCTAYDVDIGLAAFLHEALPLLEVDGHAAARDLAADPPLEPVDLAFALKALPTLEALDRAAPARLLRALRARHLLVSFPARTLGGRGKGLAAHHEARFAALAAETGWRVVARHAHASELLLVAERAG